MKLIEELLTPQIVESKKFLWQEIVVEMEEIIATHTKESEEILAKLLSSEDRIQLDPESDIPGLMSPENILKSLAIETLSKWTGWKYLKDFKKIYATTKEPGLSNMAKTHIEKLKRKKRKRDFILLTIALVIIIALLLLYGC